MNKAWERYGAIGYCVGLTCCLFGLLMQAIEIARIYRGPPNRGIVNFTSDVGSRPNYLYLNYIPLGSINQDYTMWPWSFPGIWLGILAMLTGIMGFVSARRRTYGSILGMAVLGLITFMMSTFAIAYYSIIVYFYNARSNSEFPYTASQTQGRRLAETNLAFSVFTLLSGLMAALVGGMSIGMCKAKGRLAPRVPRGGPGFRPPRPMPYYPPRYR